MNLHLIGRFFEQPFLILYRSLCNCFADSTK
jgi:hypothetical protein